MPVEACSEEASVTSVNYGFVVAQLLARGGKGKRALDFGCGGGEVVAAARRANIDMVGADIFQVGEQTRMRHVESGALGSTIFEMVDGCLPFPGNSFDIVCANTVFEHVEQLDVALAEIARVLKPDGLFLNIFPTIGVFREGHCGVPFAHWFQSTPVAQKHYLRLMRKLGFGHLTAGKAAEEWAAGFADYLQRFTFYRSLRASKLAHLRHFVSVERAEAEYAGFRLSGRSSALKRLVEAPLVRLLTQAAIARLGFVVLVAQKAGPAQEDRETRSRHAQRLPEAAVRIPVLRDIAHQLGSASMRSNSISRARSMRLTRARPN
jgi:ubiquinone/menaquinone biosynthesis C-methylase UbiE